MLQLNHHETTALLILFQNDPTLINLFNRLRTSSFTGTDGKLNHSSKWRKSSLSWTRSSQQIKLCSTLQRIFLRARSLISASWWPVKVQHRAIAQLQRDAHPEFTLPLSYLRRGPGQGEEGNQIFSQVGLVHSGCELLSLHKVRDGSPGAAPARPGREWAVSGWTGLENVTRPFLASGHDRRATGARGNSACYRVSWWAPSRPFRPARSASAGELNCRATASVYN